MWIEKKRVDAIEKEQKYQQLRERKTKYPGGLNVLCSVTNTVHNKRNVYTVVTPASQKGKDMKNILSESWEKDVVKLLSDGAIVREYTRPVDEHFFQDE